jgi:multidrug resistance efflux pump
MPGRSRRRVTTIAIAIVVLSLLAALGYRYWYQPSHDFVEVTDAQVSGNLTNISAPAAGKVDRLFFNLGDPVHSGDVVASVEVVAAGAGAPSAGPAISRVLAQVTTPVDGQVVSQPVNVGDTVAPGQPIVTISDGHNLWVTADVDEGRIGQVAPGQPVDVTLAALDRTLHGTVTRIDSATTEVINPAASGAFSSSDSTKKIPVQIAVDWAGTQPAQGTTADVIIRLQDNASLAFLR